MSDLRWFNVSSPHWLLPVGWFSWRTVRLWNLFNRVSTQGHWWGFGLLQLGRRHLLFVGDGGLDGGEGVRVCLGFCWVLGRAP